jgi:DHA2 family multidrug resistance protein-like MFS transporter
MRAQGARRWWALAAVSLGVLAVGLDGTVLTVALPTLASALHASESDLQWFTSGYFLVLAAAMLPAGLLGDRFGHKKVLAISIALFGLGSAACAFSTSVGEFLAARVLLGLAGAGVVVMAISALTVLFSPEERPKAVGVWAATNFLSLPIGPILGGWMLSHFWWGWVFLINAPVAAIGVLALVTLVPESRAADRPGFDAVGILLSVAGLVALTYGFIEAGQKGWSDANALVAMAIGVVVLVGFGAWERLLNRRPGGQPLLDLGLFRSPSFTWGVALAAFAVLAMIGVLFTMPQYFQGVLGADAMGSGLRLLPVIVGLVLGAVPAERIVRMAGAKLVAAAGFLLLAVALCAGSMTGVDSSTLFIAVWMGIAGMGLGLALSTSTSAALVELSEERSGVGSAVLQAVNKVGGPLGTAILGSALSSVYLSRLVLTGLPAPAATAVKQSVFAGVAVAQQIGSASLLHSVRSAFADGMDTALIVSAGIAVVGLALTLLFLPRRNGLRDNQRVQPDRDRELAGTR